MSKVLYSLFGLAGIGTAGWIIWQVGDELVYQSKMRPILDEAVLKVEGSMVARKYLGTPPYRVHSGGRHSVRPIFRKLRDPEDDAQIDEVVFWMEGKTGMGRVSAVGEGKNLRSVGLQLSNARHPIVIFESGNAKTKDTLFGYLASLFIKRK